MARLWVEQLSKSQEALQDFLNWAVEEKERSTKDVDKAVANGKLHEAATLVGKKKALDSMMRECIMDAQEEKAHKEYLSKLT